MLNSGVVLVLEPTAPPSLGLRNTTVPQAIMLYAIAIDEWYTPSGVSQAGNGQCPDVPLPPVLLRIHAAVLVLFGVGHAGLNHAEDTT